MGFRDDKEAMRARIQALENELESAREATASRGDEEAMQARLGTLEAKLRAARDEVSEERKASEDRNRDLEQQLEETRQALKRAEWRARGQGTEEGGESKAEGETREPDDERDSDLLSPPVEESPLVNMGAWQGQLAVFVIVVAGLALLGWMMFREALGAMWGE